MAPQPDNLKVREYQSTMVLSKNPNWARSSETIAKWLATCSPLLASLKVKLALTGYSSRDLETVGEVLDMVAATKNVPLTSVYEVGERQHWIRPGSRKFVAQVEEPDLDDDPEPSHNQNARRPTYVPMKVTPKNTNSRDLPPENARLDAYLKDSDPFPLIGIDIPLYNITLQELSEREEACRRVIEEAAELNPALKIYLAQTLSQTLSMLRTFCYTATSDSNPAALIDSPNPCGASENWINFLTRVHAWVYQRCHPRLLFQPLFVSTQLLDTLKALAVTNHEELKTYIEKDEYDASSFRDIHDLFDYFESKFQHKVVLTHKPFQRRPNGHPRNDSGQGSSDRSSSHDFKGGNSQGGSNSGGQNGKARKRRGAKQNGNKEKHPNQGVLPQKLSLLTC